MSASSRSDAPPSGVALLWDESFLWGVMAYQALRAAGLPFTLVRAAEIRKGVLEGFRTLFVPGGWASNKAKALDEEGMEAIRSFVGRGGSYLGFCGGAGLATQEGIGLLPVKRRPTKERVPSFSGRIRLSLQESELWQGIREPVFHAWWPSQFVAGEGVRVLATYDQALPDAYTSDINVGDGMAVLNWRELESVYQINLDPRRLIGELAVIEGKFGKGAVLLSLLHFDTPDDPNGAIVLGNLWRRLGYKGKSAQTAETQAPGGIDLVARQGRGVNDIQEMIDGLIELGVRNFLWFRRNPMLLQWRRGVRGLEFCALSVMVHEIAAHLERKTGLSTVPDVVRRIERIQSRARPFAEKAEELLLRERLAMQNEHITYDRCQDPTIVSLRDELFSRAKSHGGIFKELIDEIDDLLYQMLSGNVQ